MFEHSRLETFDPELVSSHPEPLKTVRKRRETGRQRLHMTHDDLIEMIAAKRDKDAFRQLFEHFAPRLKSYLMRLGADPASAEEVSQEAMVTVWRKAESFDRRQAGASTWIFTIARNKRIDRLRREKRPELDPNDPSLAPSELPAPDHSLEGSEVSARVAAAMKVLPEEQAELVRRAFYEDLSHSQIADASGLPLGTVKSRIRLALTRLRHEMKEFE